jgi:hypothetical protein
MLIGSDKLRNYQFEHCLNVAGVDYLCVNSVLDAITSLETEQAGIIEQIEMWVENSKQWLMCELTGNEEYAVYVDDLLAELKRLKGGE